MIGSDMVTMVKYQMLLSGVDSGEVGEGRTVQENQ